jgi:hypothetical protein
MLRPLAAAAALTAAATSESSSCVRFAGNLSVNRANVFIEGAFRFSCIEYKCSAICAIDVVM